MKSRGVSAVALIVAVASAVIRLQAASDVVLYASDFGTVRGNWVLAASNTAAGGQLLASTDYGWSTLNAPLASPVDYVEATFSASAGTPYHVWVRLRAANDSKYNDSIWVQFSDATDANGNRIDTLGTTSGLLVNLENCSGCGDAAWGWQDKAYWLQQTNIVQFSTTGTHTVRIQTREDGVQFDQVVLSPATYFSSSPGQYVNDSTIVAKSSSTTTTTTSTSTTSLSTTLAYGGTPVSLPNKIAAANFDIGGPGVSYFDTTSGNTGGAYRATDVDLEPSTDGGYDIGWIAAGEWVNYTVNVTTAGSYTAQLRVASPYGGSLHLGFNTPSNVWQSVTVTNTGGWQTWATVSVPVTLGAGTQQMTLLFDTAGFNIASVNVVSGGTATTTSTTSSTTSTSRSSAQLSVVTWNIQVDDSSAYHAQVSIDYLMGLGPRPQVIVIEEAHRSQYNTYLSELQSQTGQTWYGVMQTHCPPNAWNGSSCTSAEDEGVAVFTSLPVVGSSVAYLPYPDSWHSARALVRVAVSVNGMTTQVFGTHLQTWATSRYASMTWLKAYAANYSIPQIAAGDFNADMDQIDTTSGMLPNFVDSWPLVGSGNGYTSSTPSPTMKLDYWFADASGKAQPNSTYVVTSTGTFSDHFAVHTVFTINP